MSITWHIALLQRFCSLPDWWTISVRHLPSSRFITASNRKNPWWFIRITGMKNFPVPEIKQRYFSVNCCKENKDWHPNKLPRFVQTAKITSYGSKYYILSNILTSHFLWCQFCFYVDKLVDKSNLSENEKSV